jgi:hypothetical protein
MLDRMAVGLALVDHAEALVLAERSGLAAYDASDWWLARTLSSGPVTLDPQLATAIGRA